MKPRSARPLWNTITRRRHALMGTAAAVGLIVIPVTASAVVVGVTAQNNPPIASAPVPAPSSEPVVILTESPATDPTAAATLASAPDSVERNARRPREER